MVMIKMKKIVNTVNLYNLIHNPTCYKTENCHYIDLILTNRKHLFLESRSFETGYSDHRHLIYTTIKSTYTKIPPKKITFQQYKNFSEEQFGIELDANLRRNAPVEYSELDKVITDTLNQHAPMKVNTLRGNNKQHVSKELHKEIMLRTNLKNKANKTKKEEDVRRYKKQRNLIVKMNKKAKRDYYKSISPKSVDNDRKFWKMVKPMFSNTNLMSDKIILIEDEKIITDDTEIVETFNTYILNSTDSLGLGGPIDNYENYTNNIDIMVANAVEKYKNHPSMKAIKASSPQTQQLKFSHVYPWNVMDQIESIDPSKANSGNIPAKILKNSKDILAPYLTDY